MCEITDRPFRTLCKRLGADIVYTEYVNSKELLRGVHRTRAKLVFSPEERPFGIQIYGGDPDTMAEAARLAGLRKFLVDHEKSTQGYRSSL